MADEWYYTNQGQQMGPVTTSQLKELAATQRLQPTDLVWREGLPKWVPASTAKGLFPEGQSAVRPAAEPPYAAEPVAATPVTPVEEDPDADLRPARRPRDEEDYDRPRRPRGDDYDRPRRRRADAYDDEDRPRHRRRSGRSS
jgi:hypothetical protein